ncbi:MAG: hypothetical protein ACRCWM_04110 [Sarcina sp.]
MMEWIKKIARNFTSSSIEQNIIEIEKDDLVEKNKDDVVEENKLDDKYLHLDNILFLSKNKEIIVKVNSDSMEYKYILKTYKIDGVNNNIKLTIERKDDEYIEASSRIDILSQASPGIEQETVK